MVDNIFSTRLQSLRKERKVTQEQLAEYLGVSPQAVSKWENGSYPDGDLVPKIADYFQVQIDYLYGRAKRELSDKQKIVDALHKILQESVSEKEVMDHYLDLIWATHTSLLSGNQEYIERPSREPTEGVGGSLVKTEAGLSFLRLNSDLEYSMVVKEPENGFAGYFEVTDELAQLFAFLGDKDNLKVLFYISSLNAEEAVRLETMEKSIHVSGEKIESALDYLSHLNDAAMPLIVEGKLVEANGKAEKLYTAAWQTAYRIIMLLASADNVLHPLEWHQIHVNNRMDAWLKRSDLHL